MENKSILNENGFIHNTVDYFENYIDLITGAETQSIETLWRHLKNKINKTLQPQSRQHIRISPTPGSGGTQNNLQKFVSITYQSSKKYIYITYTL